MFHLSGWVWAAIFGAAIGAIATVQNGLGADVLSPRGLAGALATVGIGALSYVGIYGLIRLVTRPFRRGGGS